MPKQDTTNRSKARSRRDVRAIMVVITLLLIGGAVVGGLLWSQSHKKVIIKDTAKAGLAQTLADTVEQPDFRNVVSTLGMSAAYDNKSIVADGGSTDASSDSSGLVTGKSFENDDLATLRDYSSMRFIVRKSGEEADFLGYKGAVLRLGTNIRSAYFAKRVSQPKYVGKSNVDIMVLEATATFIKDGYLVDPAVDVTINGYQYKKFLAKIKIGEGNLAYYSEAMNYYTAQNDRPYFIALRTDSNRSKQEAVQLEAVIKTFKYSTPDQSALSYDGTGPGRVAGANTTPAKITNLQKDTANIPNKLASDTLVDVILRNQPTVVRIGASRCAHVTLASDLGTPLDLGTTCTAGIGSGTFVTKDGYVATNGHVVKIEDESLISGYLFLAKTRNELQSRFDKILKYTVEKGFITQEELTRVATGFNDGSLDPSALIDKIASVLKPYMTIADDESKYVIQTSNEPLKYTVKDSKFSYTFTNKNVEAKLIALDYEASPTKEINLSTLTHTDVALLKVSGGKYPVVKTADFTDLKSGDLLTAMGYPAFVDDGLATNKSKTVPSVTQGLVNSLEYDPTNTYQLALTSVPIAGGNSGGPSFNNAGKQIGLNTYGLNTCPDGKCFGDGTVRNMKDLIDLASKNSVTFDGKSPLNDQWNDAIDTYLVGNYKGAVGKFEAVARSYPSNYLASAYSQLATSKIGTSEDQSGKYSHKDTLRKVLFGIIGLAIVLSTVIVVIAKFHHKKQKVLVTAAIAPQPPAPVIVQAPAPAPVAPVAVVTSEPVPTPPTTKSE